MNRERVHRGGGFVFIRERKCRFSSLKNSSMYMEAYLDSKKKENIETAALDVLFFFKKTKRSAAGKCHLSAIQK